jgi:YVTN family beta-propeller protein
MSSINHFSLSRFVCLAVAILFLSSSMVGLTRFATTSAYDASSFSPSVALPAVKNTLFLPNNTLFSKNVLTPTGYGPYAIAFDSKNNKLYTSTWDLNGNDEIYVINPTTNEVVSNIATGQGGYGNNGMVYDSANNEIYVTNNGAGTVSVINGTTNHVVDTISVGADATGMALDPSNNVIYVAAINSGGETGTVSVIDATTNSVKATLFDFWSPIGVAFASGDFYVANNGNGTVNVYSGSSNAFVRSIHVGSASLAPEYLAYDSTTKDLFVSIDNFEASRVSVVDTANSKVIKNITVSGDPLGMAFDSANGDLYVADLGYNVMYVISGGSLAVTATLQDRFGAASVVYDSSNKIIYAASDDEIVVGVSTSSNSIYSCILVTAKPTGIAYDSKNNYAYVTNQDNDSVTVINGTSNRVVGQISFSEGLSPSQIAYDPSNRLVYVTVYNSSDGFFGNPGRIMVVNGTKLVGSITLANGQPDGIVADTTNGYLYVVEAEYSGNVWIVSPKGDSGTLIKTIGVIVNPLFIAFDSSNNDVYVPDSNNVTVIKGTSVVGFVAVEGSPVGVTYDASASDVLVTNSSGVVAISGSTNKVVSYTPTAELYTITYDSNNKLLYATNNANTGDVTVFEPSGSTFAVLGTVAVGNDPDCAAFISKTNDMYIGNWESGSITITS